MTPEEFYNSLKGKGETPINLNDYTPLNSNGWVYHVSEHISSLHYTIDAYSGDEVMFIYNNN